MHARITVSVSVLSLGVLLVLTGEGCSFDTSGLKLYKEGGITELGPQELGFPDLVRDIVDPTDISIVDPPDLLVDAVGSPFAPSNISPSYWAHGSVDVVVATKLTFDTTTPSSSSSDFPSSMGVYCTAKLCVITVNDLVITKAGTLVVRGKRPLIIIASGKIEIDGIIDASADKTTPGPGGELGGQPGGAGAGCGGAPSTKDGVGGAGGSFGGTGGKGGGGSSGPQPCQSSATACSPYCVTGCLSPLEGGSGGAGGGDSWMGGGGGYGGAGGGGLQLTAATSITIKKNGIVHAGGGGATRGGASCGSGGGGGSGGGILLESKTVTIDGVVAANGGGGGGGATITTSGDDGTNATASGSYAPGGDGANAVVNIGGNGGKGSAGSVLDGADGTEGTGMSRGQGGGGGGAGRICIRTSSGQVYGNPSVSPYSSRASDAFSLLQLTVNP